MKQDQDVTKDGEFLEKLKWHVEKYAIIGGGLLCDPGQWQYWEDQSTQGVSGVCEYLFRDMFQTDDKNSIHIMNWFIWEKFLFIYLYLVDLEYNGELTVKERYCEDFLKICKKYNI